jgi:preprotein translocase subunit SecD
MSSQRIADLIEALKAGEGLAPAYMEFREEDANGNFVTTGLDSRYLEDARVETPAHATTSGIAITFDFHGTQLLKTITARNIGKPLELFVNGQRFNAATDANPPIITQVIPNGSLIFSNPDVSQKDMEKFALSLELGKGLTQPQE